MSWYDIKDPHPAAMPNIQQAVDYMLAQGATHHLNTVSIYALAKHLNKQHKQVTMLIRNRPGFVLVENNGKSRGYYYDHRHFGSTYPSQYRELRGKRIISVEVIEETIATENIKAVATIKQTMETAAKDAVRNKPDFEMPLFADQEVVDRTVRFSLLPNEIARDLIQTSARVITEDGLNGDALADMATALFSLLTSAKEKK